MLDIREIREWAALGCDCRFREYAASNIYWSLRLKPKLANNDVLPFMLMSAMARQDTARVVQYAIDWSQESELPHTPVSRFVPGDHYHVLGVKFNTIDEAFSHAQKHGYRPKWEGYTRVKTDGD